MSKQFLNINYSQPSLKTATSPSSKSSDISRHTIKQQEQGGLHQQLRQFKQKAHKSFIQVTQMQSLHEEQIQLLKKQHFQQEQMLKKKQRQLQRKLRMYEGESGSNKKFIFQVPNTSFTIDCIQDIDSSRYQQSKINDTSIMQLRQLLSQRNSAAQQKVKNLKNQIQNQLNYAIQQRNSDLLSKGILDRIFTVISQIISENITLKQQLQIAQDQIKSLSSQFSTLKIQNESATKENKFLSDHLKRVHNEKQVFEKKNEELQKNKRNLQDTVHNLKKLMHAMNTQCPQSKTQAKKKFSEFISKGSFDIDPSWSLGSSMKLATSNKLLKITSEKYQDQNQKFNGSSSIKNFIKRDTFLKPNVKK